MAQITQSLAHGLDILMLYDATTSCLTVIEIAERLKFSQSKAYRLVRTLAQYGLLQEQDGSAKYSLGLGVLRLGLLAQQSFTIPLIARPFMEELRNLTKETIFLIVPAGTRGLCVEKVESEEPIRFSTPLGDEIPLYCTAAGKVLMAHLPEAEQRAIIAAGLKQHTSYTITDPELLEAQLDEVRETGVAIADREFFDEERAMAAPVLNGSGSVVASVSIAAPFYRLNKSKLLAFRECLVECAEKISGRLGYGRS